MNDPVKWPTAKRQLVANALPGKAQATVPG